MLKSDFDKLVFPNYREIKSDFYIEEFIGFDTEALKTGEPFLLCDSTGSVYRPKLIFQDLFSFGDPRVDYVTYNLKYDSGAILYYLPYKKKRELWKETVIKYKGYRIEYIPHKLLRIKRGSIVRNFWDIMPFYSMSLENAASKYLNKHKKELFTKKFSYSFARKNRPELLKYCIQDCRLTAELGNLLLKTLLEFNIKPRTFYSTASISFQYFTQTCGYRPIHTLWKSHKEMLRFANESYYGGKFEIIARGSFTGYEYDISSAYGSEIAALYDIRYSKIYYSKKYKPEADYSFLRVIINNDKGLSIPCTYKRKGLNIYPAGQFRTTITKNEYLFLRRYKIPVKVVEAWNIRLTHKVKPYEKEIRKLYRIKEKYRESNPMLSKLAKTMINSLYGKFIQVIEKEDKAPRAAMGWNPVFASIVTANIRIRLSDLQNKLGKRCLGVHTDSILTDRKMPGSFCRPGIGNWQLEESGNGLLIACGIFQIGRKSANRGFRLNEKYSWIELCKTIGKNRCFTLAESRVLSWISQVSDKKNVDINLFTTVNKKFALNCETKRVWTEKTTGNKLLTGLEYSLPPVIMDYLT